MRLGNWYHSGQAYPNKMLYMKKKKKKETVNTEAKAKVFKSLKVQKSHLLKSCCMCLSLNAPWKPELVD